MVNKYYQKHKERLKKSSVKNKKKRRKKVRDRYQNVPEEQKQKLLGYLKKYYLVHKNELLGHFKDSRAIKFMSLISP